MLSTTQRSRPVADLTRFTIYLIALLLLFSGIWINREFGGATLEQILSHASFGIGGLIDADTRFVRGFIKYCIALPFLSAFAILAAEYAIKHWLKGPAPTSLQRCKIRCALSKARVAKLVCVAPALTLVLSLFHWTSQVSAVSYVSSQWGHDYFSDMYVPPQNVKISAQAPRNLVLIYMESMETGYRDPERFGINLLAGLDELGGIKFEQYRPAFGTGWTIATIVSTQCGLPLKAVSLLDGNDQGEALKAFLPNATCLGDILSDHGYHNVFMGGASLNFAGKGKFLRDHGYHEILGREDWIERGAQVENMNEWGLHDDELLTHAKLKLQELQALDNPFNLTLLTVDTHHPEGFISPTCSKRGTKNYSGIVKCSVDQIVDFVKCLKEQGSLANTNVVIVGDHLAMATGERANKLNAAERLIFNTFISEQSFVINRDTIVPFDILPTTLAFVGFDIENSALALGISAFGHEKMALGEERLTIMQNAIANRSKTYTQLWK
jgi:phosphoglycerol transferase